MSTNTSLFDCEAIRGRFQQWQAEHNPLEAQLAESLAALSAYQSHLDAWQQQLSRERDELLAAREQFDRDRTASGSDTARLAEMSKELNAAREKISALTTSLLARTEELRTFDNRRAEVVTELELCRAREKELKASVEELKLARDQERAQRSDELSRLRDLLERSLEAHEPTYHSSPPERAAISQLLEIKHDDDRANPVLASVMEQFGKLRQQRATDRSELKRIR